jgi:signal peptidase I
MDKRVKTAISAVFAVAIISFAAYSMYDLNGKSFNFSDSEVRWIVSGSMDADPQPYDIKTIPSNSLVMIRHLSQDEVADLQVGDVIAFRSGSILITHRIVSVDQENRYFITQGDANSSPDAPVSFDRVTGKIVGVSHWMGIVVHILRDYTISVVLGTIGVVSGIVAVKSSLKIMREEKEEKLLKEQQDVPKTE